jgi:parallel beta-helix repeat protein
MMKVPMAPPLILAVSLAVLVAVTGNAVAVEYIDHLPYEITKPGYYVLTVDGINLTSDYGIRISADDVVLDGQGHVVDGDGTEHGYGVYIQERSNVTVKNLVVKEWGLGIKLGGVNNTITNNTIYSCYYDGISLYGVSNTITSNIIESCNYTGIALSGTSTDNIITNNIINSCKTGIDLWGYETNNIKNNIVVDNKLLTVVWVFPSLMWVQVAIISGAILLLAVIMELILTKEQIIIRW